MNLFAIYLVGRPQGMGEYAILNVECYLTNKRSIKQFFNDDMCLVFSQRYKATWPCIHNVTASRSLAT